jgi:EpsD family peptidyl-prolyl cis-trans isomerase
MHTKHRIGLSTLALALTVGLAGCGDKNADKTTTQVAAKVNSDAISVQQLDHELAKLGNLSPDQAKKAANQVLRSMVDQQILVQKAIEDKVDQDPQVVVSLEAARRQVLAQAYLQKLTAGQAKPGDAEVADYYAKHPELFAERRIYRLQEINVPVTPANVEEVKAQLAKSKNLNEFVEWLKSRSIPARVGQSTKAAEQLPLEILPRLHQMKDGQAMTLATAGSLNIIVVANSQTQAQSQEEARPVIERFLANTKKREAAEAELKKLREKAKIEYLGEYVDAGKDAPKPAQPEARAPQPDAVIAEPVGDKGPAGLK